MKIGDRKYDKPKPVTIVLAHGDEVVTLLAGPISLSDFEKLSPAPEAPLVLKPGGIEFRNTKDTEYQLKLTKHGELRTFWMIKESLKSTEGLEFETVRDSDPSTWENVETELEEVFGKFGLSKIIQAVLRACGLSDEVVQQARDTFLPSQPAPQK